MSILEHNGSAVIAMCGENCVAIASDLRLGVQQQTVSCDFPKAFQINDKTFLGLSGLATDIQTVLQKLKFQVNMYKLKEERDIQPETLANLVSSTLYARRFGPWFIEPIVAGLDKDNKPFICDMDLLGCIVKSDSFCCAGTANENLLGTCETFWRPGMNPEELFEVASQCLLAAVDRDCLSGWGGIVSVITPTGVITRTLKGRMD